MPYCTPRFAGNFFFLNRNWNDAIERVGKPLLCYYRNEYNIVITSSDTTRRGALEKNTFIVVWKRGVLKHRIRTKNKSAVCIDTDDHWLLRRVVFALSKWYIDARVQSHVHGQSNSGNSTFRYSESNSRENRRLLSVGSFFFQARIGQNSTIMC